MGNRDQVPHLQQKYNEYIRLVKHLLACPPCAEPWRASAPLLDGDTAKANREAVLQIQRANIKQGLPADFAKIPSYKTGILPTYCKYDQAAYEPPIPAPVPKYPLPPRGKYRSQWGPPPE